MTDSAPEKNAYRLQRDLLVVTTAVAVICDATLIPFYPKLFAEAFGVTSPRHVGAYLAATCLVVILALPVWAHLDRTVSTLRLLLVGQLGAGLLSLSCFFAGDALSFWVTSLSMIAFKASYLLVYPYVMRIEDKARHADTVGLLTVIVHLGAIAGATLGGWVVEHADPRYAFLWMTAGDFLQMAVCAGLVLRGVPAPPDEIGESATGAPEAGAIPARGSLVRLGALMLVFYFSVFAVRPFFVPYWIDRSGMGSEFLASWVFSIPAWMSLATLAVQRAGRRQGFDFRTMVGIGMLGLVLQALPSTFSIVVGRGFFGWSVFRCMVDLDLKLFEISPPASYARDFSRMNICQQLGVLVSFYTAGAVVASGGLVVPFVVAAVGFGISGVGYALFFARPVDEEADAPAPGRAELRGEVA